MPDSAEHTAFPQHVSRQRSSRRVQVNHGESNPVRAATHASALLSCAPHEAPGLGNHLTCCRMCLSC